MAIWCINSIYSAPQYTYPYTPLHLNRAFPGGDAWRRGDQADPARLAAGDSGDEPLLRVLPIGGAACTAALWSLAGYSSSSHSDQRQGEGFYWFIVVIIMGCITMFIVRCIPWM